MNQPWEWGWEAVSSIATAFSIFLGVLVFWRDAKVREFEICDRLERHSEEIWARIRNPENRAGLEENVRLAFNHYELCASYLNSMKFRGRAARNLEQHIFEVIARALDERAVKAAIKTCCSSSSTYSELRELLRGRNVLLPVGI